MIIAKLILISMITTNIVRANYCNDEIKTGPYRLELPKTDAVPVGNVPVRFTITKPLESMAHGIVAYRGYWKSFCYQGGALDSNTGCYQSYTAVIPDLDEAIAWARKGKCQTGIDYIDAWGSDAWKCNEDSTTTTWHEHKDMIKYQNNNHFAYHTCNKSWRCGFHSIDFPIINDNNTLYTVNQEGKKKLLGIGQFSKDGDSVTYINQSPKLISTSIELNCSVSPNKEEMVCYDPIETIHFTAKQNSLVCVKHVCYSQGKVSIQYHLPMEGPAYWKTASIGDVYQLVEYVKEINYARGANEVKLMALIQRVEKILMSTILSLAKIDDRLIGNILGQPMKTTFVGANAYFVVPCLTKKVESNCLGNQIFENGRWVPNSDPIKCINIKKTIPITLFNNFSLWMPDIEKVDIEGSLETLNGWSFYAAEKENLQQTMFFTKNGGKGTSFEDLSEWPSGALDSFKHFIGIGVMGTYILAIAIGIIVFCLFKKY